MSLHSVLGSVLWLFSCSVLSYSLDCSTPGFPVLHYLLEFAQTHVLRVNGAIQQCHPWTPCHPLLLLSSIFPSIRVFSNESALWSDGQSIVASASASVRWIFNEISPFNRYSWLISFQINWFGLLAVQCLESLSFLFYGWRKSGLRGKWNVEDYQVVSGETEHRLR